MRPLELARTELSGIMGCNPRSGADARRAVILVDPFPNLPEEGPVSADLLDVLSAPFKLFSAWKNQARFKPVDVALALDSTIYSRFAVYPWRKDGNGKTVSGDRAIASGALGGFSGFLLEDYRLHNYLLGRMNCQSFLRDVFTIPQENPVVVNFWSSTARNDERFFSLDENRRPSRILSYPSAGSVRKSRTTVSLAQEQVQPERRRAAEPVAVKTGQDRRDPLKKHFPGRRYPFEGLGCWLEIRDRSNVIKAINERINSELVKHNLL